jgi:hypothetical protein
MMTPGQAAACENARTPRCRCRCGGRFHGAARVAAERLMDLPENDPHRPAAEQMTLQDEPGATIPPTLKP